MSACPHRQLVLVRETHTRLRCRHCHLTITAVDLAGRYCHECFERWCMSFVDEPRESIGMSAGECQ